MRRGPHVVSVVCKRYTGSRCIPSVRVNHQSDSLIFAGKDGMPQVEELYHIYENYGDSVTFIESPKAADAVVSYPVDAQGNAIINPVDLTTVPAASATPNTPAAAVPGATPAATPPAVDMNAIVQAVMAALTNAQPAATTTPAATPGAPDMTMAAGAGEFNPFSGAE